MALIPSIPIPPPTPQLHRLLRGLDRKGVDLIFDARPGPSEDTLHPIVVIGVIRLTAEEDIAQVDPSSNLCPRKRRSAVRGRSRRLGMQAPSNQGSPAMRADPLRIRLETILVLPHSTYK